MIRPTISYPSVICGRSFRANWKLPSQFSRMKPSQNNVCSSQVYKLGYLKDSNAAAHSVDSDIFYAVIYLSARSTTCSNLCFSK